MIEIIIILTIEFFRWGCWYENKYDWWWCYNLIFTVVPTLSVPIVRTIVILIVISYHIVYVFCLKINKTGFVSNETEFAFLFSISYAMYTQIILNHPSLENFTAFAYNADEEIHSLVHNTIIHELHFNMLHNPMNVIQKQIELSLLILSIVHIEQCGFMLSWWVIPRDELASKPLDWIVNHLQFNQAVLYHCMIFKVQSFGLSTINDTLHPIYTSNCKFSLVLDRLLVTNAWYCNRINFSEYVNWKSLNE